jgi:hypothetical protein
MNYKIIMDEDKLKDFINWLPELKPTESYYLCLFARSKYTKDENGVNGIAHIKSDKAQLKRFVSDKDRMFQKIKQLEVPLGAYTQKDLEIPQNALALYITPNPRDLRKATFNSLIKLAQCIRDTNDLANPHQEVLSEIQKAKGTGHFVDFDIDLKDLSASMLTDVKDNIVKYVNPEAVTILRTRGGVHCLVNPKLVDSSFKNSFYQNLKKMGDVDQTGDQMIPVPGTFQGGFIPHFISI